MNNLQFFTNGRDLEARNFQGGYRGLKGREYFSPTKGIAPELEKVILETREHEVLMLLADFLGIATGMIAPIEFIDKVRGHAELAAAHPGAAIQMTLLSTKFMKVSSPKVFAKELEGKYLPLFEKIFSFAGEESRERLAKFSWGAFRLEAAPDQVLKVFAAAASHGGLQRALMILRSEISTLRMLNRLKAAGNPHIG